MDISEIEPNSHKYKMEKIASEAHENAVVEQEESDRKVIAGTVKKRRRSLFKRFGDIFFTEDVGDVKTYLIYDVLIPAVKENIAELINSAVSMIFFGEASRRRTGKPIVGSTTGSRFNYNAISQPARKERMPNYARSSMARDFDDVAFESRAEAELVLDQMLDAISNYGQVTLLDFYDFCGMSTSSTDAKYGWTDLHTARVVGSPSRGYSIDLPSCRALRD